MYARMHIILTIDIFRVFLFILFNHPKSLVMFFLYGSTHFVTKAILNHNTDSKCYIKRMGSCSICSINNYPFSPCEYLSLALGMDTHMRSLTHSTHSLHSLHSLTDLLTYSPTHSLQLLTHSLTPLTHSTHPLTHPLNPLTHSLPHSPKHTCMHQHTYVHAHAHTYAHIHTHVHIHVVINNPVTNSCVCMHPQI